MNLRTQSSAKQAPGPWWHVNLLIREKEHLQRDLDGDDSEKHLEPTHDLERAVEAFDLALVLFDKLGGEDVGPELDSVEGQCIGQGAAVLAKRTLSPLPKET